MLLRTSLLPWGLLLMLATGAPAVSITLDTSDSPFVQGVANQGWWSDSSDRTGGHDNYFTGNAGGQIFRGFFTFNLDLLGLLPGQTVTGGNLQMQRYKANGFDSITLEFFDVTSDAEAVNTGVGLDSAIFDDLGSGISFGNSTYPVAGEDGADVLHTLNTAALDAINSRRFGYFTIGVSMDSPPENTSLFAFSGERGNQLLVLEVGSATSVPEGGMTIGILGVGAAWILGMRRMLRRQEGSMMGRMVRGE